MGVPDEIRKQLAVVAEATEPVETEQGVAGIPADIAAEANKKAGNAREDASAAEYYAKIQALDAAQNQFGRFGFPMSVGNRTEWGLLGSETATDYLREHFKAGGKMPSKSAVEAVVKLHKNLNEL